MPLPKPELERLQEIMATLRGPDGCPWYRAQDLTSLRTYVLEEAHEVLAVMDGPDTEAHRDELGDLLLQVALHAQIRSEEGAFHLRDVVDGICDKMIRRHPHVFGDAHLTDAKEVDAHWEALKDAETPRRQPADVPPELGALLRAEKIGQRAARLGFDWPDAQGPYEKIQEELTEVYEEFDGPQQRRHEEIGDLLFSVVNLARHLDVHPELALHDASERFLRRFAAVRTTHPGPLHAVDAQTLDDAWEAAKRDERG